MEPLAILAHRMYTITTPPTLMGPSVMAGIAARRDFMEKMADNV